SDDAGTANTASVTLSGVSDTSFHNVTAVFRLPANPPSGVRLRVKLTTALENAKSVYLGRMALAQMTPLLGGSVPWFGGGPLVSFFSGNTKMNATGGGTLADAWTVAVTNAAGAFQKAFERAFNMKSLGYQLPSSGSPTINDNLVA